MSVLASHGLVVCLLRSSLEVDEVDLLTLSHIFNPDLTRVKIILNGLDPSQYLLSPLVDTGPFSSS